jgi:hypothetical protein
VKSLFDPNVFTETVKRVEALQPSAPRQWGKMTPAQMLEHAARVLDMACGKGPQKQILAGRLLSWTFRRTFLGEEPFGKNAPTGRDFVIQSEPDLPQPRIVYSSSCASCIQRENAVVTATFTGSSGASLVPNGA